MENQQLELAYTRTHLANERTFAAWVRTALAMAAGGFGVAKVGGTGETGLSQPIGIALVLLAVGALLLGCWSFSRSSARLSQDAGAPAPSIPRLGVYAIALLLAILMLLVIRIL